MVALVAAVAGSVVILATLASAVRTVVLPRASPSKLARGVLTLTRVGYEVRLGRGPDYARRDAVFASYGPVSLLVLLQVWLLLEYAGFAALHWSVLPHRSVRQALGLSGSSLFTLGFDQPSGGPSTALTFLEASIGLVLLALLIAYLPVLYGAFSRREQMVSKLEVRAGAPPSAVTMLTRFWELERLAALTQLWLDLETWFVDVEETHTSFPSLVFFRSPAADKSWVTAAGAVLDAAALLVSSVAVPTSVDAQLTLRSGFLALRSVAGFFRIPYDPDPAPDDPITIRREEYEEAMDALGAAGLPLVADREQGWRDFAGWRVTYDVPLVALATLTNAPFAPWSSDRTLVTQAVRRRIEPRRR